MKWDIWVQPNQIITENYPDGWSHEDVMRAADARYGGKVTTVTPAGESSSSSSNNRPSGSYSSSSGGGGCGTLIWLVIGIIAIGMFGGGEKEGRPSTPPESLSQPQSRVEPYREFPAPEAVEEPMFRDYPTPPPSYCVTENFEPC